MGAVHEISLKRASLAGIVLALSLSATGCAYFSQLFGLNGNLGVPTLAVGSPTATSLTATWSAVSGATSYQLFRDTSANGSFSTRIYDGSGLTYVDTGLSLSTTYYYKVQAANASGVGSLSAAKAGTTLSSSGSGSLTGLVVDSVGGSAVAGASVSYGSATTTTGSDGSFSFSGVAAGTNDLVVSASDRAGSKLQAVTVTAGNTTEVELVEPVYDHSATDVTPPTIAASGISAGQSYSGSATLTANVTPGSSAVEIAGTWAHDAIDVGLGNNTNAVWDYSSETSSISAPFSTSWFPPGELNVRIVAYDDNNNRSELDFPIVIASVSGAVPTETPAASGYSINADTYGTSYQLFETKPASSFLRGAPRGLSTATRNLTQLTAENDSTIYVYFTVQEPEDAWGISVYRASSAGGPYTLVGKSIEVTTDSSSPSGYDGLLVDTSAQLTPGQTFYYQIAYFASGEGQRTNPIPVTILPKYNLDLTSPANNTVLSGASGLTPTLQWSVSGAAMPSGATRTDIVHVVQVINGDSTTDAWDSISLTDQTSVSIPALHLTYGSLYEWNVESDYALTNGENVISYSYTSEPVNVGVYTNPLSNNGWWYFSVTQ